ncbi:GGDEF domain-containing protein [Motiliproteus sediminis]|uniref:GGDEF domain-containing protein n=1 Tax=Motiliproteus sediminis TaxID=1468178 RepID=UPI001AEFD3DE|nr:sensor domain-containing diguanylate cyclase [Motiliproteus sediminis]
MNNVLDVSELHWMLDAIQRIEVGLVIIDRSYRIKVWNGFMEHHSGISPSRAHGRVLFELLPDLPRDWLQPKLDTVLTLNTSIYSTWEQRSQLFRFEPVRPITGDSKIMYQNVTLSPLGSVDGGCDHVCLTVYDVTDEALGKIGMERANRELAILSSTDRLTGLFNRGHWEQQLQREFKRFQRYGADASLVMLDIDHFKRINDGFGHQAGDEVIRTLGRTILEAVRDTDVAGRYGGEEFAIILSDTSVDGAVAFCERLRVAVEQLAVEHDSRPIPFTISLGVARIEPTYGNPDIWLSHADQALYAAKESGRNRVVRFDTMG